MSKTSCLVYCALTVTLAACQTTAPRDSAALHRINATLKHDSAPTHAPATVRTPPAAVSAALLPPLKIDLVNPGGGAVEQRFDITVTHAQAREFFMSLVEGTPYNMVVHPDVNGEISLTLKNVTIGEVMDAVRDVYGYEYQRTASGYQVMPIRMQSRVFQVNYLDVKRTSKSETRVNSGQVSDAASSNNGNNGAGGTTASNGTTSGGIVTTQPSSQLTTESEGNYWDELKAQITTLIGSGGGRSVVVSPQAGIVVVRALPAELREVDSFLSASQTNLQRQVVLEAKIIEVSLSDGFQSGINWAALGEVGTGKTVLFGQTGGGTIFNNGTSEIAGNPGTLDPGNFSQVQGTNTSAFGGVFSAALNLKDFNAFIELLKSQGDVQVLSSPRVSTVNNQPAVIKVGSDEFFVTNVSTTTTAIGNSGSTNRNVTLTPFFSGIALDVTPQIDAQGQVILHIHPTVSSVKDQTKTFKIDDKNQSLPLAFSTVRESDSIVRASNGQVVVLGGLMQDKSNVDHAGVPVLGDAPGIGGLFRHTKTSSAKSELVILLRPIVIESGKEWSDQIRRSSQHLDQMQVNPTAPNTSAFDNH
ncbi:MAG: pilus (MSHA type) biogenesis protein MshL [Gammaproteobacteria bacterium]